VKLLQASLYGTALMAGLLMTGCASQPDGVTAQAADPNKKICRAEQNTESRIPQRMCKTRAEWEAYDARERESGDDYRQANQQRNRSPFDPGKQ